MNNKNLPKEIERKYLIKIPSDEILNSLPECQRTDIVQTYLTSANEYTSRRLRKRGTIEKGYKFYYTEKTPVAFGEKIEIEREISEQEYNNLISQSAADSSPINKERYCFKYEGQLFELDVYSFSDKYATLEIELNDINDPVLLPDFIDIISDVTDDNRYSNAMLAKTKHLDIFN